MAALHPLPHLYLASRSPRRKQLLESLGLAFDVLISDVDEEHPTTSDCRSIIVSNAVRKAESALKEIKDPDSIVIAADTLVVLTDRVLGKPRDLSHAQEMLRSLSGNMQQVFTGLVLQSKKFGMSKMLVESKVYFRKVSEDEIKRYTETVEPYDKAGGYAIQGIGAVFIDRIEGSYTNVMGLPIETLLRELELLTKISLFDWIPQRGS